MNGWPPTADRDHAATRRPDVDEPSRLIEALVRKLEAGGDEGLRATARELVQALMDLHRIGLQRTLAMIDETGEVGRAVIDRLAADGVVKPLLVLHGLHPLDLQARVHQAMEHARVSIHSHGSHVERLVVSDAGGVQVTLSMNGGSAHGHGLSAATLRKAVEDAIYENAPDAVDIVVDVGTDVPAVAAFVPLSSLRRGRANEWCDAPDGERGVARI